jgi:hypothetical protein
MTKHNQETNFGFMRELTLNKSLGNLKIGDYYGNAVETERTLLRCIYYKRKANEFKQASNTRRIELTEYKNNIIVNIQKVKR